MFAQHGEARSVVPVFISTERAARPEIIDMIRTGIIPERFVPKEFRAEDCRLASLEEVNMCWRNDPGFRELLKEFSQAWIGQEDLGSSGLHEIGPGGRTRKVRGNRQQSEAHIEPARHSMHYRGKGPVAVAVWDIVVHIDGREDVRQCLYVGTPNNIPSIGLPIAFVKKELREDPQMIEHAKSIVQAELFRLATEPKMAARH